MIGVSMALALNFPDQHQQFEHIKKHAPSAIVMATIIFAAGIFLGVLKGSMMLNAIAESVVTIIPSSLVPHLHLIIGFFGTPFELILNTDAYYFALFPVIQDIVSQHGVSSFSAAYAMIVGNIIGTFISPFSPALWLAIGLARLDMGMYIRYAFLPVWGFTLVVFFLCFAMGIF
jgi:CitMHS family citrate-Mg2+:H+ or citrate-Ca2+:H+ symporter